MLSEAYHIEIQYALDSYIINSYSMNILHYSVDITYLLISRAYILFTLKSSTINMPSTGMERVLRCILGE